MFTLRFGDYTFPNQTFVIEAYPINEDVKTRTVPRAHGSLAQAGYLKERRFRVRGVLHNSTEESTHDELIDMQENLINEERQFKDREDRYINAWLKQLKPKNAEGSDKSIKEVSIDFVASDPFFHSTSLSTINFSAPAGLSQFDSSNIGNVFAEPVFSFYASAGDITDGIQLTNRSSGDKIFKFRGTVSDGTTLAIDADNFTVRNNGVDGLSYFEGDFMTLVAGSNTLEFNGSECEITVAFRPRFTG